MQVSWQTDSATLRLSILQSDKHHARKGKVSDLPLKIFTPHLVFAWVLSLLENICSLSTSIESNFSKRGWVLGSSLGSSSGLAVGSPTNASSEMSSARKSLSTSTGSMFNRVTVWLFPVSS